MSGSDGGGAGAARGAGGRQRRRAGGGGSDGGAAGDGGGTAGGSGAEGGTAGGGDGAGDGGVPGDGGGSVGVAGGGCGSGGGAGGGGDSGGGAGGARRVARQLGALGHPSAAGDDDAAELVAARRRRGGVGAQPRAADLPIHRKDPERLPLRTAARVESDDDAPRLRRAAGVEVQAVEGERRAAGDGAGGGVGLLEVWRRVEGEARRVRRRREVVVAVERELERLRHREAGDRAVDRRRLRADDLAVDELRRHRVLLERAEAAARARRRAAKRAAGDGDDGAAADRPVRRREPRHRRRREAEVAELGLGVDAIARERHRGVAAEGDIGAWARRAARSRWRCRTTR